jgi:hypothetical protein
MYPQRRRWHVIVSGVVALAFSAGAAVPARAAEPAGQPAKAGAADPAAEIARLREEIERLKGIVPDAPEGRMIEFSPGATGR